MGQVAHTGFLRPAARVGHDENAVLGIEKLAKLIDGALKDGFEIFAAVRQHRLGLLLQDLGGHVHRAGDEHG